MSRVFVTGIGVISSIGLNAAENHSALVAGQCGISLSGNLPTRFAAVIPFGEIPVSTENLKIKLKAPEPGTTRTTLLALHAFREAIADANFTDSELTSVDTALVGASTVGGMCLTDQLYRDATGETEGSEFLSSYDNASIQMALQNRYKMGGLVTTINTACSSSSNSILFGARLISHGLARRAIVGGAESLAKFTINGFNALQILSPTICRPFDADRQGLNLGEGAAFLVLEKEEDCRGKQRYAELTGFCNTNDAFHPSSLSADGEGPYMAMKGALRTAGLAIDEIGFINAHGTGTENNDAAESRAMLRLFGEPPAFGSSKSNIGHTLGASGAIEAVYSIFCLLHQEVYESLNFLSPIEAFGLRPVTAWKKAGIRHVMSNSFGFGGNCTSLIFSKAN